MKDYKVISGIDESTLSTRVNNWLNKGYELVGGVSVSVSNPTDFQRYPKQIFAQALVKFLIDKEINEQ